MRCDVLILVALLAEERLLEDAVEGRSERVMAGKRFVTGRLGGQQVVLTATGMGKVNAAAMTTLALQQIQPRAVIGTGIAGGTDLELLPGDVVVAERVAHHDFGQQTEEKFTPWRSKSPLDFARNPLFFPASNDLLRAAMGPAWGSNLEQHPDFADRRRPIVVRGTLVTGDTFGATRAYGRRLREQFEADACDMESVAISQICRAYDVPFLAIRGISDVADGAMGQLMQYAALAMTNAICVLQSTLESLDFDEPTL